MNKINFIAIVSGVSFFFPRQAYAASEPNSTMLVSELLMFAVIVLMSAVGGGYSILKKKNEPKWSDSWTLWIIVGIIAIIVSAIQGALVVLVSVVLLVIGVKRGIDMIRWGIKVDPPVERPAHLAPANAKRLIPSGIVLVVLSVGLFLVILTSISASTSDYRARGLAAAVNADVKSAYLAAQEYAADNTGKSGIISCADLETKGFKLSLPSSTSCVSNMAFSKGKLLSGDIVIMVDREKEPIGKTMAKPGGKVSYDGNVEKAQVVSER